MKIDIINNEALRRAFYEALANVLNDARALTRVQAVPRYSTDEELARVALLLQSLRS